MEDVEAVLDDEASEWKCQPGEGLFERRILGGRRMRDTNGVLFLNVELEVHDARARGGDAEL
jgi:hypothetical protein